MLPKTVAVISVKPVIMLQVVMFMPFVSFSSRKPNIAAAMLEESLFIKLETFSR